MTPEARAAALALRELAEAIKETMYAEEILGLRSDVRRTPELRRAALLDPPGGEG